MRFLVACVRGASRPLVIRSRASKVFLRAVGGATIKVRWREEGVAGTHSQSGKMQPWRISELRAQDECLHMAHPLARYTQRFFFPPGAFLGKCRFYLFGHPVAFFIFSVLARPVASTLMEPARVPPPSHDRTSLLLTARRPPRILFIVLFVFCAPLLSRGLRPPPNIPPPEVNLRALPNVPAFVCICMMMSLVLI